MLLHRLARHRTRPPDNAGLLALPYDLRLDAGDALDYED
jgi:hypothetical protein